MRSTTVLPEHAAMLRNVNGKMLRMYDAALSTNLNADFPVNISCSNAEILTCVLHVRSRALTIERDDPYGSGIIRIYQNNICGADPFPLQMKVGKWVNQPGVDGKPGSETFHQEVETNRLIEEAWLEAGHKENCTVRRDMSRLEVYLQMVSAIVRDGGWLMRHYAAFPNNKFRYAVDPIESDRLDQYYQRPQRPGQNEIQFSIEMDEYHGPVNYWILTRHPGDVFVSWSGSGQQYREPVPARDITAIFDIRSRAGQYVGMSRLAPCIQAMHQVRQFDVAHLTAAIWSACKPLFIIQEFPTAMGDMVPTYLRELIEKNMGIGGEEGEKLDGVNPGETTQLPYGQKPFLVDPKFPVEAAEGFKRDQLKKMATGSGVPYFILAQDWGAVNFSSGRLGLDDFHDTCEVLANHIIAGAVRPWFNRWLEAAILSGQIDIPYSRLEEIQRAASFRGRCWPYVQPVQDAEADIMLIGAGIKSRDQTVRERGGKGVEEINAQIASDHACDASHGLDFSAAAKQATAKAQPPEQDEADEADETDEADECDESSDSPAGKSSDDVDDVDSDPTDSPERPERNGKGRRLAMSL